MAKAAPASPGWTDQHDSALSGLVGLGFNKNYSRTLLSQLQKQKDVDTLMNLALKAHGKSFSGTRKDGPTGAVPVVNPTEKAPPAATPPPSPAAAQIRREPTMAEQMAGAAPSPRRPPPEPVTSEAFSPKPPSATQPPSPEPEKKFSPLPPASRHILNLAQQQEPLPPASRHVMAVAQAQTPAAAQTVKPRVRVRAAGRHIPAAPFGQATPQNAPAPQPARAEGTQSSAPVRIYSTAEYEQLAPGTRFIWPDGHIYRKPEEA